MIKSAVTISLVPELSGGPWVYQGELDASIAKAKKLGFDAVELFIAGATSLNTEYLNKLLDQYSLGLSAIGTGAGKVLHGLTLTDPDKKTRELAKGYIKDIIHLAAGFNAPAIIGSMQGNISPGKDKSFAISLLIESLTELADYAGSFDQQLLFEPLNRYESNICNQLGYASSLIEDTGAENIAILADLFHMNIEEVTLPSALRSVSKKLGYIHFADSNRRAAGMGHLVIGEIADTLNEIDYHGYLSAEVFPQPDPDTAAGQTIDTFRKYFNSR